MLKSFPKILSIFFLSVFILQLICLFFLLAAPVASQAAGTPLTKPGDFAPQVEIPGYKFDKNDSTTGNIAELVKAIYNYAIGIVGILAAVVLMVGGVLWIIAGGNTTQISEAKAWIGAALTGLVLALTSYLILSTVNPALVNLKKTSIPRVAQYVPGACIKKDSSGNIACVQNSDETTCKAAGGIFSTGTTCSSCCAIGNPNAGTAQCSSLTTFDKKGCDRWASQLGVSVREFLPSGQCKGNFCNQYDITITSCCAYTKGMFLECFDNLTITKQQCEDKITKIGGKYHSYEGATGTGGKCSSKAGEGCVKKYP